MKYQIFSDNEWIYPDSDITQEGYADLHLAKNSDDCFQVLTDVTVEEGEKITITAEGDLDVTVYQLLPVCVEMNSGADVFTTLDYDKVKNFVTRQAPFYVYDVTRDIDDGTLRKGRVAFFVRVSSKQNTPAGEYKLKLSIQIGESELNTDFKAKVYNCAVPELSKARFGHVNWIYHTLLCDAYGITTDDDKFLEIIGKYLENQIELRNTHFQIPSGVPVRDENGKVIDFDFRDAINVGNLALEKGFNYIYGGFVARWNDWTKEGQYLLWNRDIDCTSEEGYRQLSMYFSKLWKVVRENNWENVYMQGLVDEPQFANSISYRIVSAICRKYMPGIKIIDPQETTELYESLDISIVKQETYNRHQEKFDRTKNDYGHELWVYTCGYPAGDWMNRILDLSPLASRLPCWMAVGYGMKGFLHWGYHCYHKDQPYELSCFKSGENFLPPGNGYIVYPGESKPWNSVRAHIERGAVQE